MIQTDVNFAMPFAYDQVWQILSQCRGQGQAMNQHQLAAMTGIRPRRVREIIAALVVDYGYVIGSGQTGYYVVTDAAELAEAKHELYGRLCKLSRRLARIEHSSLEYIWGQMKLRMEPADSGRDPATGRGQ
jgi:hypothetical protein